MARPAPDLALKVVFFDLDGVLVDSQGAENDALLQLAQAVNAPLTPAAAERIFTGRRIAESVDYIAQYAKRAMPPDPVALVRASCEALIAGRMRAVPRVEAALRAISLPKYVVSNSPLEMIRDRLRMSELEQYFGRQHFSAYEVGCWKPDPGLYLVAAAAVSARPHEILVIEDSHVGVQSAVSAGMRVMWYQPVTDDEDSGIPGVTMLRDMGDLVQFSGAEVGLAAQA